VAPPYVNTDKVRVYVVTSKDWNAMAMANGAIWVFQGLLEDMSDDEVAFIVGHELAHVTHEHSRQANLKALWATAVMVASVMAAEHVDNKAARIALEIAAVIGPLAWVNRYNRAQEDQADRVGLRYAYEGGFDPAQGSNVWTRFQAKYGDTNRVLNFFIGDHSTARQRIDRLRDQMAMNYGPLAPPRQPSAAVRASGAAAGLTRGLVASGSPGAKPAPTAILPGMPFESVRSALGAPISETAAGADVRWVYDECTIVFTNGRVSSVAFDRRP
jgi:predicted Zn-dependent protease